MNYGEQAYLNLCKEIINNGIKKEDRTGTGTYSIFGYQMRFDLNKGFPLLTTKKVPFRLIASELLWFIKGDTNIRDLLENNNNIWNEGSFKKGVEVMDYKGQSIPNLGRGIFRVNVFKELYPKQWEIFKEKFLKGNSLAKKYGNLGSVYGKQWREWETSKND